MWQMANMLDNASRDIMIERDVKYFFVFLFLISDEKHDLRKDLNIR